MSLAEYSASSRNRFVNAKEDRGAHEPDDLKLTVIIPLYNKEATIHRAVESVLSQLGGGDKLLVIDDGSADGSSDVLAELSDPRLHLVSQENQGVSVARNRGIQSATTEHVAFLDADDWWMPGVVRRFKQMILECPNCSIYTVGHLRHIPGQRVDRQEREGVGAHEVLSGVEFISRYSREQLINSSTSCVKKQHLEQIGGFPSGAKSGEDIYVWLRVALLGHKVAVCHDALSVIERGPPGSGGQRDPVPYHIHWFTQRAVRQGLDRDQRSAIARFVFRRSMNLSAGEVLSGRRRNALQISFACARINVFFVVPLLLVSFSPGWALMRLYETKHNLLGVPEGR